MNSEVELYIEVLAVDHIPINATVTVKGKDFERVGVYQALKGNYLVDKLTLETEIEIEVIAQGYEPWYKKILITENKILETVILAKEGMSYYYQGKIKVPFQRNDSEFGLVIQPNEMNQVLEKIKQEYHLTPKNSHPNFQKNNLFLFEYPASISKEQQNNFRKNIAQIKGVTTVGAFLNKTGQSASLMGDEIIAKFKATTSNAAIENMLEDYQLIKLRSINYIPNGFQLKSNQSGYDILTQCEALMKNDLVEYAEPNLFSTNEDD